jgi:hypothetical protein
MAGNVEEWVNDWYSSTYYNVSPGNYGTHSLRKTWGYHARMNGVDFDLIMYKLNHNRIAYSKRYLGITDDEIEEVVKRLN